MRYGMSYKGSKSRIALEIINALPEADCLVDLFGGGGAITHCALKSGKFKKVIYNELDPLVFKGFKMAVNGEFKNEIRWISREDFNKLKNIDSYAAICFSFGNDLRNYAYSLEKEKYKKSLHEAIFLHNYEPAKEYGFDFSQIDKIKGVKNRYKAIKLIISKNDNVYKKYSHYYFKKYNELSLQRLGRLESLQSLESLQRLESLQSLESLQRLELYNLDYRDVVIPQNSVIYCDIPYKNTDRYNVKFKHEVFYNWAKKQKNIFISEFEMPNDFKCIYSIKRKSLLCATNNSAEVEEKLFVNKDYNHETQLSFFDDELEKIDLMR